MKRGEQIDAKSYERVIDKQLELRGMKRNSIVNMIDDYGVLLVAEKEINHRYQGERRKV